MMADHNGRDEGGLTTHDYTEAVGPGNRLTAIGDIEFLEDVFQV